MDKGELGYSFVILLKLLYHHVFLCYTHREGRFSLRFQIYF